MPRRLRDDMLAVLREHWLVMDGQTDRRMAIAYHTYALSTDY